MMTLMLLIACLNTASASPKERLKVKYKVRTGGKGETQRMKVAQEVMQEDHDVPLEHLNSVDIQPEAFEPRAQPEGLEYKQVVTTIMSQLERAARSQDL